MTLSEELELLCSQVTPAGAIFWLESVGYRCVFRGEAFQTMELDEWQVDVPLCEDFGDYVKRVRDLVIVVGAYYDDAGPMEIARLMADTDPVNCVSTCQPCTGKVFVKIKHVYWKAITVALAPLQKPLRDARRSAVVRKFDGRGMRRRDHLIKRAAEAVLNTHVMAMMGADFERMDSEIADRKALVKKLHNLANKIKGTDH